MIASQATSPLLEILGLSIKLPAGAERALAVDNTSLMVMPGQTLCIVGESGSGKSMIANATMGLLASPSVVPVAGKIMFDGIDLLQLDDQAMRALRGRRIGMIFQEPMTALNPVMRIGQQLEEIIDAHENATAADKRRRILSALADVGLPDPELLIDSYPFRLSGGQRQRVLIACALILEPALLIADEPTTALDVTTQAQILALIRDLQHRRGTAVLFITHDFGVVAQIAHQVVVMQTGQVVESGSANQVLSNPQHPYTRKLIAAIPDGQGRDNHPEDRSRLVLEVKGLHKTYRSSGGLFKKSRQVEAVKNISFDLSEGQTLGLVGESGSGKSTLGRCLVGLTAFDSGQIIFNGEALSSGDRLKRSMVGKVQMVFQDPYASLNPRHRIGASIAGGPVAQGVSPKLAMEQALALLQLVGLDEAAAQRYPHEFSGGQRQRIAIARALAMKPALLVADEPVSALDVSVQAQILELFTSVRQQFNLAIVFITHDLRVAGQMCNQVAVMQRGEIVEFGETFQVLTNPTHAYTRQLVEAIPRLTTSSALTADS